MAESSQRGTMRLPRSPACYGEKPIQRQGNYLEEPTENHTYQVLEGEGAKCNGSGQNTRHCKDGTCCRLGNEHPDHLRTSPECQVAHLNVAFVHTWPYTCLSHRTSFASSLCSRFPFFPLASRLPFST